MKIYCKFLPGESLQICMGRNNDNMRGPMGIVEEGFYTDGCFLSVMVDTGEYLEAIKKFQIICIVLKRP